MNLCTSLCKPTIAVTSLFMCPHSRHCRAKAPHRQAGRGPVVSYSMLTGSAVTMPVLSQIWHVYFGLLCKTVWAKPILTILETTPCGYFSSQDHIHQGHQGKWNGTFWTTSQSNKNYHRAKWIHLWNNTSVQCWQVVITVETVVSLSGAAWLAAQVCWLSIYVSGTDHHLANMWRSHLSFSTKLPCFCTITIPIKLFQTWLCLLSWHKKTILHFKGYFCVESCTWVFSRYAAWSFWHFSIAFAVQTWHYNASWVHWVCPNRRLERPVVIRS